MTEQQWEKKLKIVTTGRDASHANAYRYPYEPTPYCVLERLADSGYIGPTDTVVDYGCGRGRVSFFLTHRLGCRSTPVPWRICERLSVRTVWTWSVNGRSSSV